MWIFFISILRWATWWTLTTVCFPSPWNIHLKLVRREALIVAHNMLTAAVKLTVAVKLTAAADDEGKRKNRKKLHPKIHLFCVFVHELTFFYTHEAFEFVVARRWD